MAYLPRERTAYDAPAFLTRPLDLARVNGEVIAFLAVVVLSIVAHLYNLGHMALHHDESIHAWMSWKFLTGNGGFTCYGGRTSATYCYEPTYHGPALYVFTLFSYFLFGDGDWQARLPEALTGIGMVASVWMLRSYLGRAGTLTAAVLLGFAPTLLYYTRFARHDGLILLWTLWMVIGFFRFLDTGRARYLYLLAAGAALAIATHELYYILFFIFGWFLLLRAAFELLPRRTVVIALAIIMGVAVVVEILNPRITATVRAGGMALLFLTTAGLGLLMTRVWDEAPVLVHRVTDVWRERRGVVWTALILLAAIYSVMYSTFFADIPSLLTGLYAGLQYWLGSQQEFARGDQPWYYHLMLLSLYEPLALYGGLATVIYLLTQGWGRAGRGWRMNARSAVSEEHEAEAIADLDEDAHVDSDNGVTDDVDPETAAIAPSRPLLPIFPLFLAFWFVASLVAFSWAGEKMPWLTTHIALPGNLLVAWAIGRLITALNVTERPAKRLILVPFYLTLLLVAFGVAFWRFSTPADSQQNQAAVLQGILPLAIGGGLLYALLMLAHRRGWRPVLAAIGLTVAGILGAYMIRATWMVVYDHPDTPVEPLVYVQSTPDVPLIAADVRELAINQTRNSRSANDPVGGLTMPVIMDSGDPGRDGEGSLAWPYQWYFRDFKRLENRQADFFRTATGDSFMVDAPEGNGQRELAPVVMVSKSNMNDTTRAALEENYVKKYDSKLNWWFPEGYKCDPASPGYKRFYYNTSMVADALKDCPGIDTSKLQSVAAPLLWPFDTSHWGNTWKYLLYRQLPDPLRLDGREIEVWVRGDLVGGSGSTEGSGSNTLKLVAQQVFASGGDGQGQLNTPSSAATDAQGNLYVADTQNHRIEVFNSDGTPKQSIGSFGSGDGQFYEPRGVAVDAQGNIYVADTWNARVVKLDSSGKLLKTWGSGEQDFGDGRRATVTDGTEAGNAAKPLGFFGPRGIAVDGKGNVYVADTGNKRIVVTDGEGNFLYQWGAFGAEPGHFSEPTGVAVDAGGSVYVADTWNGRVQVFAPDANGRVGAAPSATWRVPGWQPQTYDDPSIAVSGEQVLVSTPGRNSVLLTDLFGAEIMRWGGTGSDLASMSLPSGVTFAPDGTIFVVDRGNSRIMHFKLPLPGR